MADGPPLRIHAVAIAADLKPDHAPPKRIEQHPGIGCIIAQIGDNECIGIVAAIDLARALPTRTATAREMR
jgi:hypothetical protein